MYLGILMTNRCNAHCDHCAPESGPLDQTELSLEEVFSYIAQAAEIAPQQRKLALSGGEVFLHYPRLLKIVEFAHQHGFEVTVTSNAFWARTVAVAREKLRPLLDRGLTALAVSRSQFHQPFVPVARVRNCLLAAGELGLPIHLKVIVTRSHPLSDLLKELDEALALSAARVEPIPCYPFGRARELVSPSDFYLRPGIPMTPCPGATLTISPSGEALPCCNPGGDGELLAMGSVRERSITDVAHSFSRGSVMRLIHTAGPGYFVSAIRERGLGHKLLPEYVSVCHLCGQIAGDPELVEVARDVARQEEEQRLRASYEQFMAAFQQALEVAEEQPASPTETSAAPAGD